MLASHFSMCSKLLSKLLLFYLSAGTSVSRGKHLSGSKRKREEKQSTASSKNGEDSHETGLSCSLSILLMVLSPSSDCNVRLGNR